MKRALVVCPGRGSYGRDALGSLAGLASTTLDIFDSHRARLGRPTVRELDAETRFSSRLHLRGEHASILTAGVSLADLDQLVDVDVVAVCGNSMGWYTALTFAGALATEDGAELIDTMGWYQAEGVIGGQLLYPLTGPDWRPDPERRQLVQAAIDGIPGLHWSIHLGGQAVLGGTEEALAAFEARVPPVEQGAHTFPLRLPLHSAFHTPLMADTSHRARLELAGLAWRAPRVPLIDGRGGIWRPLHADPTALAAYTLHTQVVEAFDLSAMIRTALREYAPDLVVLPGPGHNLGGAIAQVMIAEGWRGLHSRDDFLSLQAEDPVVVAMRRPEQRVVVA